MTNADRLMLERLVRRAEDHPWSFNTWELARLDEWEGRTDLSVKQVAVLTRLDLKP